MRLSIITVIFKEPKLSIRRQSEGVYAILNYLAYEKQHKRKHPEWEKRLKVILDSFLRLQNADGSFPRKFKDDFSIVDGTGGSTPSATLPLVMAYKYCKDKRYLESAKRTVNYLENELISKSDYFSSTLDANCEDKEAPFMLLLPLITLLWLLKVRSVLIMPNFAGRPLISPYPGIILGMFPLPKVRCWVISV